MPSHQSDATARNQLLAMRDASAESFEAARTKYYKLLKYAELVSLEYVCGKIDESQVRAVTEQLLEAEFNVAEMARRTRIYQEAFEKLMDGYENELNPPVKSQPKNNKKHSHHNRADYIELFTTPKN